MHGLHHRGHGILHALDTAEQPADLVLAEHVNRLREIAAGDPFEMRDRVLERLDDQPAQREADCDHDDERDRDAGRDQRDHQRDLRLRRRVAVVRALLQRRDHGRGGLVVRDEHGADLRIGDCMVGGHVARARGRELRLDAFLHDRRVARGELVDERLLDAELRRRLERLPVLVRLREQLLRTIEHLRGLGRVAGLGQRAEAVERHARAQQIRRRIVERVDRRQIDVRDLVERAARVIQREQTEAADRGGKTDEDESDRRERRADRPVLQHRRFSRSSVRAYRALMRRAFRSAPFPGSTSASRCPSGSASGRRRCRGPSDIRWSASRRIRAPA
ncbi:hypothetical protein FEP91_05672 [Burkholderia multivorans]|nr:hypothetical protein [Burkholderia multivorans]